MNRSAPIGRIDKLLELMAALRDPARGCAWDIAQTATSIVPYTIEEAYEVAGAVVAGNPDELRDELGDLLLQVVFQAQIAKESGQFEFADVVEAITAKLVRRHPHVFDAQGSLLDPSDRIADPEIIAAAWERIKAQERAERRSHEDGRDGPFSDVAKSLPALLRAEKLSRRAAAFGFDWTDPADVVAKVREEIDEVEQAMGQPDPVHSPAKEAQAEEIGDLLFSVANLARHLGIDPENALRKGNAKFERRFTAMARFLGDRGASLEDSDLDAMEAAWQQVKASEKR